MAKPTGGKLIGAIIAGVIYLIFVVMGVMVKVNTNDVYAHKTSLNLFWLSCIPFIVLVFCLKKESPEGQADFNDTKESAKQIAYHILLWVTLTLLPFRTHYMLSTFIFMAVGLFASAQIVTFAKKEDYDASQVASFKGMSSLGKWVAIILFIALLLVVLFTDKKSKKAISESWKSIVSAITITRGSNAPEGSEAAMFDGGSVIDDTFYPDDEKPNQMIATITNYAYPFDFGKRCPIAADAAVTVNFAEKNISIDIALKKGHIIITDGSVSELNEDGLGKFTGYWTQDKTGFSGSYVLEVEYINDSQYSNRVSEEREIIGKLSLYYGNKMISEIEIK